jgi:predicted permease
MFVIDTIAPLALIVLLGAVLRRSTFASEDLFRQTNRLVFWVGLPCLLFSKTARPMQQGEAAVKVFVVLAAGMLACMLIGYLVGWALRLPRRSMGAFVQGAYRSNLAYLGLPIVLFALASANKGLTPGLEATAVLAIAPLIPLYNAIAVFVLLIGQDHVSGSRRKQARAILFRMLTNPLLLACVAGILYSQTGLELPVALGRTLAAVGQMALPLALLGVGASLNFKVLRGQWLPASAGALIKVAVAPLLGYALGRYFGLDRNEMLIALLYLGCPTAVVSYLMAQQLDGDSHLAAGIVVLTVILSLATLSVILSTV